MRRRQTDVPALPTSVAPERNLPAWVDTIVAQALMPNPEERYPSVTAFAEAFHEKANPPLIRINWPRKQKASVQETPITTAVIRETETVEQPLPQQRREPTRIGRWARKEFRNARRAVIVFALMVSLVVGLPMFGGNQIADWSLGLLPGSTTTVIDGNWNLRVSPGTEGTVLTVVQQGQSVRVTGAPRASENDLWWPVRVTTDDQSISGWTNNDGLKRTWLMNRAADYVSLRDSVDLVWHDALSLLPG